MALLVALAMTVIAILSAASLAFSWITRRDMHKILAAFEKGHPYSDPSAAAVVTPSPSPGPVGDPTPVSARIALPAPAAIPSTGGPSRSGMRLTDTLPPSSPDVEALRARFHAEADERDARDATAPPEDEALVARMVAAAQADEDDRPTDEGKTKVLSHAAVKAELARVALPETKRPPPHKPPVKSNRPTLLDGFAGAPERPVSNPTRAAADFAVKHPPVALNTRTAHRIELLFWSKLSLVAQRGASAPHCEGPRCNAREAICGCPCEACARRRELHTEATTEIVGSETAGEIALHDAAPPSLHDRIVDRWHVLQEKAEATGEPAIHCDGPACQEFEEAALCECDCEACGRAVGLLVQAEEDVVGLSAAPTTPPDAPANDARDTPSPEAPPAGPALDARVERRWHALIAEAQEAGKPARHCHGSLCVLGACVCRCDGCDFIAALLRKAKRGTDR